VSGGRREEVRVWHQVGDDYPKTMFSSTTVVRPPGSVRRCDRRLCGQPAALRLLASAAIEIARRFGEGTLIVHAHDWHAALVRFSCAVSTAMSLTCSACPAS